MSKKALILPVIVLVLNVTMIIFFSFGFVPAGILAILLSGLFLLTFWAILKLFAVLAGGSTVISFGHLGHSKRTTLIPRKRKCDILRVVKDPHTGKEIIIGGNRDTTYRHACLDDWDFERIPNGASWILRDERGNDISDSRLVDYDGIVTIELLEMIQDYYPEDRSEIKDEEKEYSTTHLGVEFYD